MKRKVISTLLIIGLLWVVDSQVYIARRSMQLPEISTAFAGFQRGHNGRMPSDLHDLVRYARQQKYTATTLDAWPSYIYVANLTTNDPAHTPCLIYLPPPWRLRGIIMDIDRGIDAPYRWDVAKVVKEPWLPVQDRFKTAAELDEFKSRVKVILPGE